MDQAGYPRRKTGGMWFSFNLDIPSILNSIFHFHKEMYSLPLLLNREALSPPLVSMDTREQDHRGRC